MNALEAAAQVHAVLMAAGMDDAIGGALALAYHAEPRGTVDADVDVAAGHEQAEAVVGLLAPLGWVAERSASEWLPPVAGVRLVRPDSPVRVDLFFSLSDAYDEVFARREWHSPLGEPLPFLTAEDLTVFKLVFDRPKDWVDIEAMLQAGSLRDLAYVERKALEMKGPRFWPSLSRLAALAQRARGED